MTDDELVKLNAKIEKGKSLQSQIETLTQRINKVNEVRSFYVGYVPQCCELRHSNEIRNCSIIENTFEISGIPSECVKDFRDYIKDGIIKLYTAQRDNLIKEFEAL